MKVGTTARTSPRAYPSVLKTKTSAGLNSRISPDDCLT